MSVTGGEPRRKPYTPPVVRVRHVAPRSPLEQIIAAWIELGPCVSDNNLVTLRQELMDYADDLFQYGTVAAATKALERAKRYE